MAAKLSEQGRLTAVERQRYDADGFLVREAAFDAAERAEIIDACESLVVRLISNRKENRVKASNYVFDSDLERETMIKWEGDTDIVHGIEPFAHLDPALKRWAHDPRFVEPMIDFVGDEHPSLFTEKLNLKRPGIGGVNPLHQDYPYWVGNAREPARVATAMLLLDDSSLENGCLQVVPGSHKAGEWRKRADSDEFGANEIDASAYEDAQLQPVPLKAGSMVMFGSLLVHCSAQNTSQLERRALLFSYQPAGYPTSVEKMAAEIEAYRKAKAARAQQTN